MSFPVPHHDKKASVLNPRRNRQDARALSATNDAAWLAQFSPVDDVVLNERQQKFLETLQAQHPQGQVGRRADGPLCFYAIDPSTGRFSGLLPAQL